MSLLVPLTVANALNKKKRGMIFDTLTQEDMIFSTFRE